MADETVKKLYNVEIQGTDALKTLADLRTQSSEYVEVVKEMQRQITNLRKEQKQLDITTEEGRKKYNELQDEIEANIGVQAKYQAQLKATNKEAAAYEKQITNSIKLQNQQEASLEKLRTQLSLDNAEFVKLGNSAQDAFRKNELGTRIAATTAELKRQEEALGDHRRSVGDYAKASRELKQELTDISNALLVMAANGEKGSETYKELADRAKEIQAAQSAASEAVATGGNIQIGVLADMQKNARMAATAFGLLTTATTFFGKDSKEAAKLTKALQIAMTALTIATQIAAAATKTNTVSRVADMVAQKVGINQTLAETKALAAKNATTVSGAVATKVATATTWLWNAALAANPVVLLVVAVAALTVGLLALTGVFKSSSKESQSAARSMDAYKASVETTTEVIKELERVERKRSRDNELALAKEVEALKANGATKQQIAAAELAAANRQRGIEIAYAKARMQEREQDYAAAIKAIQAKEAEIATWSKSAKKLQEAQEELKKLREEAGVIKDLMSDDAHLVEKTAQETIMANREANEQIARDAHNEWVAMSQRRQKIDEETLKARNVFHSNDIKAAQEYERDLFNIQQNGDRERLAAQRKFGDITAKEYADQLKLLDLQAQQFNDKQLSDLNDHYKKVRDNIVKQVGSTDLQIAEVITAYDKAMKELASVEAPVRLPGMSDEDFAEAMDAYEAFLFERAELEKRLTVKMEEDIQTIKDNSIEEQVKRIEKAISREYKDDFEKFSNNERKKLQILIESLQKQIAAKKEAGLSAYADEAALQQAQSSLIALNLNTDLMLTGKNAKARYDLRKEALLKERELYKDNADEQLRIDRELFENEQDLFEARIQAFSDYASAVGDMLSALNDLFAALDERESQRIEEKYAKQQEDLDNALQGHLISQSTYDKKVKKLEEDKAKEEAKLKREQAVRDRIAALFNIAVNTATGIMSAVASFPLTGGLPWSAIVAALGAVQAAAVLAQPLPKAAKGKYITGKTHAAGGTIIEAEAGETIINRKSTSMFLPLLSAINEMGGGVPFTTVGSDGGYALRSAYMSGGGISRSEMGEEIRDALKDLQIITTVEDYRRADENYVNIKDRGTV